MSLIPKALFPNVPQLPGVPQLLRSAKFPASPGPVLGTAAVLGRLWQAIFAEPTWGIYKQPKNTGGKYVTLEDGTRALAVGVSTQKPTLAIQPDSFLTFSYVNESELSDYPTERGGFLTYNKVANPYESMVTVSKGGSKEDRRKFVEALQSIAGTMDLYYILTPEKKFYDVNVKRVEISRERAQGAYFLTDVNIYFREIRFVTAAYSSTALDTQDAQDAGAQPAENTGAVQPQPSTLTPEQANIESAKP